MITATAMGDFFGFKGSIAETALNPDRSDHLSDLVAVSNVEDLKTATSECAQEIHRMAQDPNGSSFLKSLFAKLSELRLIYEIVSLFDAFTGDPEQVKPTVCYTETGCQTFFSLLGYCDHIVKGRRVLLLPSSHPSSQLTDKHLEAHLEPILTKTCQNINLFCSYPNGLINMRVMVMALHSRLQLALVNKLNQTLLIDAAFDAKGNFFVQSLITIPGLEASSVVVQLLSGKFVALSKHKYATHVVQSCVRYGSEQSVLAITHELAAELVGFATHPYANHVLQHVLKRSKMMKMMGALFVYKKLRSEMEIRRLYLENDPYGKQVLETCDRCERI